MPKFRTITLGGCRLAVTLALLPPLAGVAMLWTAPAVNAQASVVREINVTGNRRIEPETVRSYMKISVGDAYDAGRVDESIRALFATGLFSDVRVNRQGAGLLVTVVENPIIAQVVFEGNSEVDKPTLEGEVQLKPRAVFTRSRVQADVQRILDVYRRQGRFAAKVEPKIIELENNRVNLVFEINEGGATKVKGINFIGNRAFNDSQLRDIITTTQQGLFDFLKGTAFYDPDRLSLDRELLRQYYLKNGYADVRVVSANAELDRDGSGFYITYVVDEGEIFKFGNVEIKSSLPAVNVGKLKADLLTQPGDIYNAQAIDKTVERMTLNVSEQGFAFARVRPKAERERGEHKISMEYVVDEGPRVYIERINIIGNQRTMDYVIRREFRLAEGDAYNPLMVDAAKKRLTSLGFFKAVEIKRHAGSASDRVILDVELTEQSTGELSFGAGFSTSEGVIGDVSITERNLLGRGQFLRLKLAGSVERLQVDLSFTEPRFLDRNIAAGFDLFHKTTNPTSTQNFSTTKDGGGVRLAFPLAENLWLGTSYSLSYDTMKVDPTAVVSRAITEAAKFRGGNFWTSAVGTSLTWDNRNHPKSPTRGTFFQASSEFAGVGGDVQYIRVQGEGRAYYPLTEKITLVGRVVAGEIQGWGGQDVRLLDLFYRGGETIRGFNRGGYGPRDTLTGDALGGTYHWSTTAELRFPIPFVPDDLGVSAAIFADAGSLFGAGGAVKAVNNQCGVAVPNIATGICLVDNKTVRSSVGGSIIWNSPLGPLRLDIAKAITKDPVDKLQILRFGAATKF